MSGKEAAGIEVGGIDHVTIVVEDLERSRHFYCDVLGMRAIERPEFPFPGLWFLAVRISEDPSEGSEPLKIGTRSPPFLAVGPYRWPVGRSGSVAHGQSSSATTGRWSEWTHTPSTWGPS